MTKLDLRKFVAPEFVFGVDARLLAGRYAKNLGARRVLVVSDPGVLKAGWTTDAIERLEAEGLQHRLFTQVSPNPRDHEIMAGVEYCRREVCDTLLAVGGGSVMDCAKGIGIVVANGGNILDYEGVDQVHTPMPPLICIPTTGGTSADVSQFAIVNNTANKVKIAIVSKAVVPDASLVDPRTLTSVEPYLTACTGMDALVHAIEAFVSNASSPLTDLHAVEATRQLEEHLMASVKAPADLTHRGGTMLGSLEAGLAFSNASLGCVHALAHSLGGFLDLPHGECNALLLPHVVDFNFEAASDRYLRLAEVLGLELHDLAPADQRRRLVNHLVDLRQQLGIAGTLKDRGLKREALPILAAKAIRDPCNATNPRTPCQGDLLTILENAM